VLRDFEVSKNIKLRRVDRQSPYGDNFFSVSERVLTGLLTYQVEVVVECRFYHEPGTEAVTNGIKVSVATAFVPTASTISPPHFRHAYRITYVM